MPSLKPLLERFLWRCKRPGVEFIQDGVRRVGGRADPALLEDLLGIAKESARLQAGLPQWTEAIATADRRLYSAVNYLETCMVLAGPKGGEPVWRPLDAFLARADIAVVAFDGDQAQAARNAFLRFGKGRHPAGLDFGDCAAYALAKSRRAPLLFKGGDFLKTDIASALARAAPKADSSGSQ